MAMILVVGLYSVSATSGCGSGIFEPVAGYEPATNVTSIEYSDKQIRAMKNDLYQGSPAFASASFASAKDTYKIDSSCYPECRSLQNMSLVAKAMMNDCAECPFKHYLMFHTYYGDYDYADKWIMASLDGAKTSFTSGRGDADFSQYTDSSARAEAATKGSAFLSAWMFSIGMFETAVAECDAGNKDRALNAWDRGVALYVGSLEGASGISKSGTFGWSSTTAGEMTYALADQRCKEFKTCGAIGGATSGGSRVNSDLLTRFNNGQRFLNAEQCSPMRAIVYNIVQLMTVPLVQSVLKLAYTVGQYVDTSIGAKAEAAAYVATLLPQLYYCDNTGSGRTAASTVYNEMRLGGSFPNFFKVKAALEQSYQCLGITCAEVGGIWDAGTGAYIADGAKPCTDAQASQTYTITYTPIAGYTPGSNVIEHNEVDLDQKDMNQATNLADAEKWYKIGGNSQKSGGRLRTIRGFSTGAYSKMYKGCESHLESNPDYTGVKCYRHYKMFYNYYGDFDYADKWVQAAIDGVSTAFTAGRGNADFSTHSDVVTRMTAAQAGAAYMATWMYTVREFEDAIDDCIACDDALKGCNDESSFASVHAWDEGVAFYTGSLEGTEGLSKTDPTIGAGVYALAETRCVEFKTCGSFGGELTGGAKVNHELLNLFMPGNNRLNRGECAVIRPYVDQVVEQMTVPLIQSVLLYAYKLSPLGDGSGDAKQHRAYGAAYAASLLPLLHFCDLKEGRTTAAMVYDNMQLGADSTSFTAVKEALEASYSCLKLTCFQVGGLWNAASGTYHADANPCGGVALCGPGQTGSDCKFCGPGYYYSSDQAVCVQCVENHFKSETSGAEACTPCPANSKTSGKGAISASSCACKADYVGVIASSNDKCYRCNDVELIMNDFCPGSTSITVPEGYYKTNYSTRLHKCRVEEQCAYTNNSGFAGTSDCIKGSTGPLCGACDSDHMLDMSGHCIECDTKDGGLSILQIIGISVIFAIFVLFEAWSAFTDMKLNNYSLRGKAEGVVQATQQGTAGLPAGGLRKESAGGGVVRQESAGGSTLNGTTVREVSTLIVEDMIKVIDERGTTLSAKQRVPLVAGGRWNLRLVWLEMRSSIDVSHYSPVLRIMISYYQIIGLLSTVDQSALDKSAAGRLMKSFTFMKVLSFDFLLEMFEMVDCGISQTLAAKTASIMMTPVLLIAAVAFCCALWKCCVPNVGFGEFMRALSFGMIVLYSAIISKLLGNLSSVDVGGDTDLAPTKYYIRRDTSVEYGSDEHVPVMIGSIVYAVVYGLVIPFLFLYLWWKGASSLSGTARTYHYGFLVKGYKREWFWWEYTVLVRRFLCCLIVSVSCRDPFLTASLIAVIFILSIHFHMIFTPYSVAFLNLIEAANLMCILLSVCANMVAYGTRDEAVIEYAAAVFLATQLFFILLIIVVIWVIVRGRADEAALATGRSITLSTLPAIIAKMFI